MGLLNSFLKTELTEGEIKRYLRLRYNVESVIREGEDPDTYDLERYHKLKKRIEKAGINLESRYREFKEKRKPAMVAQPVDINPQQQILTQPDTTITEYGFQELEKGEKIRGKQETQQLREDGSGKEVITRTKVIAGCGCTITQTQVKGFCEECKKSICGRHVSYCQGFGDEPCQKVLCPKHTYRLEDSEEKSKTYCREHYELAQDLMEIP